MRDLSEIRVDINKIDGVLKDAFLKRMELVNQVMEYKRATNTPVKNKGREADILKAKLEGVDEFYSETSHFFKSMIEISCNYQDQMLSDIKYEKDFGSISNDDFINKVKTVCHQGAMGSYSYEVAKRNFCDKEIISVADFSDVFEMVSSKKADVGILPIENLSMGCVSDVYDLLSEYDVYITHCTDLPINHCLAGVGGISDVKKVVSHMQALGQCRSYIDSHSFVTVADTNTAVAAKRVSEMNDKSVAAICSVDCARTYNLNVLDNNISDISHNTTRFIIIANNSVAVNDADRLSIIFTLRHETGSLSRVLNDFAKSDINMTKIESRPIKNDEWKYTFFVDLEMPDFDVTEYFSKIRYMFDDFKISGIYKTLE